MEFVKVARSTDVTGPRFTRVTPEGRPPMLLTRLSDDSLAAFGTICPHQNQALDDGVLWEDRVDCPHHHYTYDPRTGENVYPRNVFPAHRAAQVRGIPVFEVREEDGWVLVGGPVEDEGEQADEGITGDAAN